jgi:hypothetical protein
MKIRYLPVDLAVRTILNGGIRESYDWAIGEALISSSYQVVVQWILGGVRMKLDPSVPSVTLKMAEQV